MIGGLIGGLIGEMMGGKDDLMVEVHLMTEDRIMIGGDMVENEM